ncbi:T6SS immunity protein Tli4 family protein [Deefgea rivuli]|uniref:T6SS immunity protein Tli4 family protein n=1 Tax=Deefgea rivuli TaxID=400948 RepID=UPI00047F8C08|nr:T6SS immunity protein Tli4 family protein [Deefgea rivuli]
MMVKKQDVQSNKTLLGLFVANLWFGLVACTPSEAQPPQPVGPTVEEIAAYHPSYQAKSGTRSECLGRLVFEVSPQAGFEWGLPRGSTNEEVLGFSRILQGGQDMIHLADVAVVIIKAATPRTIIELRESVETDKAIGMHRYDVRIRENQSVVTSLQKDTESPEIKNNQQELADYQDSIKRFKQDVLNLQQDKADLDKYWHPTDWGIADSTGYLAGSTLYAFLYRGGYAFQFMSTGGEGETPYEQRVVAFKKLLSNFEYRPLYQVPNKPGLCLPHGFVVDDGKGHFSGEVSYRYTDSPSVIYTLGTAIVGERNFSVNEPMLEATARSSIAGVMGGLHGRQLKVLGPKEIHIGARPGILGGISTASGVPGYSVYAASSGWEHSQVLPFISLNMRSFDRATDPDEIKVNPPAFAQSLQRFELTLSTLRTRK